MTAAAAAWVLRCSDCAGGLVYAVTTPETTALLTWLLQDDLAPAAWVEEGALDRLWEIDYCTCTEDLPHAHP